MPPPVMIRALYYGESGVEIEGSADALRELSDKLVNCDGTSQVALATTSNSDTRGLSPASVRRISVHPGPVAISRSDTKLSISGSKEKLLVLAQNVSWLADHEKPGTSSKIRDHIHVEYHPGHFFLAAESLPLTVIRVE